MPDWRQNQIKQIFKFIVSLTGYRLGVGTKKNVPYQAPLEWRGPEDSWALCPVCKKYKGTVFLTITDQKIPLNAAKPEQALKCPRCGAVVFFKPSNHRE